MAETNGRRVANWLYGITSGIVLAAIIALTKMAFDNEHRLSVLEANYEHMDVQLDRMERKLDALLEKGR